LGYAVRDFTPGEALERISREVIVTRFSRLLYTLRDQNTRVAEVLPFLEGTFFGDEIFRLPQGMQARRMPAISPQGMRWHPKQEEEVRAKLDKIMNPSPEESLAPMSMSVSRDFCSMIWELMDPFVLYYPADNIARNTSNSADFYMRGSTDTQAGLEAQVKDEKEPIGGSDLVKEIEKAQLHPDCKRTFLLIATSGITKDLQGQGVGRKYCHYFGPGASFNYRKQEEEKGTETTVQPVDTPPLAAKGKGGKKRQNEQLAAGSLKYTKATFVLPPNLEVVVLNEDGLAEFLTPQNVAWLSAVREGRADFVTFAALREWEVKILSTSAATKEDAG